MSYIANITLSYLRNAVSTFFIKKKGKRKKEDIFLRKKPRRKIKNSVTIMISADGKGAVFPAKLKLEEELFE